MALSTSFSSSLISCQYWQVKNNLHGQLDVSFNEDAEHARQGNAGDEYGAN